MKEKEMVRELPQIEEHNGTCEVCQFGKQTRLPFPKQAKRATQKLQLVHSDICGPQRVL